MPEKYGFVYIWFDHKHKRYYIGCHWGCENDGYICSSNWMRDAYTRRPQDFKRKVIARVEKRKELYEEEFRWLSMIREEELRVRYYNLHKRYYNDWTQTKDHRSIRQKMREAHLGKTKVKGRNWFNNGIEEKMSFLCPEGWQSGRLKIIGINSSKRQKGKSKGKYWFNDGYKENLCSECPNGWMAGRLDSFSEKNSKTQKGKSKGFWYNNGIEQKQLESCPDGWRSGRLFMNWMNGNDINKNRKYSEQHKNKISNGLQKAYEEGRRDKNNLLTEYTCSHCGKIGKGVVMLRHHFDNCKHKENPIG